MKPVTYHFWITNLTNIHVSLADLGLIIPARKNMNLLDKRYHTYSNEDLINSAKTGSLYKKRDKIAIRHIPPEDIMIKMEQNPEINNPNIVFSRPLRSTIKVEEVFYEELDISDEMYANDASELTDEEYATKK